MLFSVWCLIAGLATALAHEGTKSHPIVDLAQRGIRSDRLDSLQLGASEDDAACYCALACDTLTGTFGPEQVDVFGEQAYDAGLARFWSVQQAQETKPRCFFHPLNAQEVSVAVLLSRATQCPFAVRGAGHAAFKGASNSDGGLTIDFINMRHVVPSADRKSVALSPGNTWHDVYTALEKVNLTMVGGRVASVGVGGLILGGGISFFSGQHGWACDNIVNYEVVVASGEILEVNAVTEPDLYWALRAGGGNFGIVTQFVANSFEQGLMWGGDRAWEMHSTKAALINAMIGYVENYDPKAAIIVSFAYAQAYNMWVSVTNLVYSDPQPAEGHPAVFDDFFAIENAFQNTPRTTSHSDLTNDLEIMSPWGARESYWMVTTHVDKQLASDIIDIFQEEVAPLTNFTDFVPAMSFQIISVAQRKAMLRNGGNAMGIGGGDKPLLITNISARWALKSDDTAVLTAYHNFVTRVEEKSRARNLFHPFLYMNYASQWQDPIASYGAENKARLLEVSKKYDPEGVFQKLHPGYFKLAGAPLKW
ncbi:Uu.00g125120.m01.CDS01 [Anthostomella pinea]|uniref:Uu.00g125120.m01.CDS01 n=1 Tax=Anthostomella pinea TaxID=933095 RepID=A0AAI8VHR8_9PEZI|nr:Uu.00g125120.m01.CDS01 [Anthostomella pinea]